MIDCEPRSEKSLADPLRESPAGQVQNKFPESANSSQSPAEMTALKRSFPPPDLRCKTFRSPLSGRFRAHPCVPAA
jgi:hypothetical protein